MGNADELTRLQLLFIVQCQVVYAEKLDDLDKRNKHASNPLTIYDSDDEETRAHKLAMIDEFILANGQDIEYE